MAPQQFLVPVDFSKHADMALEYTITLAHNLQARLFLLHAADATPAEGSAAFSTFPGRFDVATELMAHSRQHPFGERVILARAETGIERRRDHFDRYRLLDRGQDGPPAFARILHKAAE